MRTGGVATSTRFNARSWNRQVTPALTAAGKQEAIMGFGRGALLWLLGVPLPIIIILALFMNH